MLNVVRGAAPETLRSTTARAAARKASRFYASGSEVNRQRNFSFDRELLNHETLRAALYDTFRGLCAFCSSDLGAEPSAVGHYRPPQGAVDSDASVSWEHYHWLAYHWENLYLFCQSCLLAKGAKFPVDNGRTEVGTVAQNDLLQEGPRLLDPCGDRRIEGTLIYMISGEVVSFEEHGKATINVLDLNRLNLVKARREQVVSTKSRVRIALQVLDHGDVREFVRLATELYSQNRPYAAVVRQFANQQFQFRVRKTQQAFEAATQEPEAFNRLVGDLPRVTNAQIREAYISFFFGTVSMLLPRTLADSTESESDQLAPLPNLDEPGLLEEWEIVSGAISNVELKNFMGIDLLRLNIHAQPGEGRWTILLGENGVGKTTVLKAVALALGGEVTAARLGLVPTQVLAQGANEGHVRVRFAGGKRVNTVRYKRHESRFTFRTPVIVPVIAFGQNRVLARDVERSASESSIVNVASLFDPSLTMANPASWLHSLSASEFDAVVRTLKRLLPLQDGGAVSLQGDRLTIHLPHGDFELNRLSAGYQAMAGMCLEMMRSFLARWGSLEAAEGIVLIDEIGAHLHPTWQMRIVSAMKQAFPRVQVIATTHDPLCLRGLWNGEATVLRRSSGRKAVFALNDLPPIEGLAVDQLLTSEHFGLNSTIDPETDALLREFQDLLAGQSESEPDSHRLAALRDQLAGSRLLGATQRERLALEAADEFLGRDREVATASEHHRLKEETQARILAIWSRT